MQGIRPENLLWEERWLVGPGQHNMYVQVHNNKPRELCVM